MKEHHLNRFTQLVAKFSNEEGEVKTIIPEVAIFRANSPTVPLPVVYNPCICFLAQGDKQVSMGGESHQFKASEYVAISVDLPLMGQITKATPAEPYLVVKVDIDLHMLSELLLELDDDYQAYPTSQCGFYVGQITDTMGESLLRLLQLWELPEDIPVLAAQMKRELFYRLLKSEHGQKLAQVVLGGSHTQRVSKAIYQIKQNLHHKMSVEELAELSGMSVSSFHAHFKSVTAMSPLQYQKLLRLMAARHLMFMQNLDAAKAAYEVGYESASQFSREYARMFGKPPQKDVSSLRESTNLEFSA